MSAFARLCFVFLVLSVVGCGDKDSACDDGAMGCDGDVLQTCADGSWETTEDCSEEGMICHDMGDDSHCMPDGAM